MKLRDLWRVPLGLLALSVWYCVFAGPARIYLKQADAVLQAHTNVTNFHNEVTNLQTRLAVETDNHATSVREKEDALKRGVEIQTSNSFIIANLNARVDSLMQDLAKQKQLTLIVRDLIDGTDSTHAQLREWFPFGYVIFFPGDRYEIYEPVETTNTFDYRVDWRTVKIHPNFVTSKVTWVIPNISAIKKNTQSVLSDHHLTHETEMRLNRVSFPRGMVRIYNQPSLGLTTLSTDQRRPVFALGFRIQSERTTPP